MALDISILPDLSNDTFNQTNFCEAEDAKTKFKQLHILFTLEVILGLASLIINASFLIIIRKVKVMPINIRCLLTHLSLTLLGYAAATMYKAISYLSVTDPCSLGMNAFECRLRELPLSLPWAAMFYSLSGISIERLVSTFRSRSRDHAPSSPVMSGILILAIWAATLFTTCLGLAYIPRDRTIPVCELGLSKESNSSTVSISINMILEISAMAVMVAVTIYEKYVAKNIAINRVLYSLSARFYITQNVEVNGFMLPSMMLHVVCYLPNMIFYLLAVYNTPMSIATKWMVIHLSYLWILFYSLCHPILAFARNFHVKKQFKKTTVWVLLYKVWKMSTGRVAAAYNNSMAMNQNIKAHFEHLEQIWATSYERQRQN